MSVCNVPVGAWGGQMKVLGPLMWLLCTKLRFSGGAARLLTSDHVPSPDSCHKTI